MKIVILAAGRGERLMPLTRNTPKPLLDLGTGRTLLEQQIWALREAGCVDEIVLVIGYLAEQIEAKMRFYDGEDIAVRTVFNPFFGVSNNLMSLWLARHEMNDDFMVTNGDNLFAPEVFSEFVDAVGDGIHLAVGPHKEFDFDDMRVSLDRGAVARVSKKIPDEDSHAESPGLCLIRGDRSRSLFVDALDRLARDAASLDDYWLQVFNNLYDTGVTVHPWEFDASAMWQEIDFHSDVDRLKETLDVRPALTRESEVEED